MARKYRKKPLKMFFRVLRLLFSQSNQTEGLVQKSYDRISTGYDETWTHHMRDLTEALIEQMHIGPGQEALDLTCGTGYATSLLATRTNTTVIGVDASQGMLDQARINYADCNFVADDILRYLRTLDDNSLDVITCCWGLGYCKPLKVLREIRRVLKKGGKVGIIDNTIFSLREVMYSSMLAFMEQPDKLENLMKFKFLMGKRHIGLWYRRAGLKPTNLWAGEKSYVVGSGSEAIARLKATGAAAGFEYASKDQDSDEIYERFGEILEQKYMYDGKLTITHRYLGGIAVK